uniref:Uncharacterized protein n=1 Tax=Anguilla anguilla TaxID=7936 RepID=A0A0E9UQ84_ANGAN
MTIVGRRAENGRSKYIKKLNVHKSRTKILPVLLLIAFSKTVFRSLLLDSVVSYSVDFCFVPTTDK